MLRPPCPSYARPVTGRPLPYVRVVLAAAPDDVGAETVARRLRDAGVEVVFTALPVDPAAGARALAATVLQEDPDALVLPGTGPRGTATLRAALAAAGLDDVPVVTADGTPDEVVGRLRETLDGAP